jgi:acetoin utilization deacetylase AcuC-like enzyme
MTGICSSPRFADHRTGPHHPERPDRIRAILRAVREAGMLDSPDPFPDFAIDLGLKRSDDARLVELDPPEPAELKWVELVHPPKQVERIKHLCDVGGGVLDQGDTAVGKESFDVARLGVGALLRCCDAVMNGTVKRAFAAVRPPGHHAEPDRAMGFCLLSNIAIAARYLQQQHGLEKIGIVDFDVHHGNGTQAVFEADRSVFFISLHQDPRTCYPGTGYAHETGTGPGEGFTLNLPMPPAADDTQYLKAFDERVLPTLDAFKPQAVLISAGFDAHRDDPLAQVNLSEECFETMTRELVRLADQRCNGRVISVLEGGYHLRALGRSVVRHLRGINQ